MNDFILTLMLLGAMSSGNSLPFWATSNRFGLMPEANGGVAWVGASTRYDTSKEFQWRWGASMAAGVDNYTPYVSTVPPEERDFAKRLLLDELYGSLRWKVFSLDLGMKHHEQAFMAGDASQGPAYLGSLSSTAGHLIWSGNARSIPGYSLNLEPVVVPFTGGRVTFSASYGDYRTLDNRYVKGALVHNTMFGLGIKITDRLDFYGSLDHYAFWGGTHPSRGKQPSGLRNYIRVVTGSSGGSQSSVSDQINVIGDQRGSEIFGLRWRGDSFGISFQHEIPYDDGSGMGFQNFPDGVNTLHVGFNDKNLLVSDILFEYSTTMWQSGTRHDWTDAEGNKHISGGGDNYFNNSDYRSGWTNYGRTIGFPLFFPAGTRDHDWYPSEPVLGVENNRLKAVHFGVAGKLFRKAPYKLMLTYGQNYGRYGRPYEGESQWGKEPGTVKETSLNQFSAAFMGEVPFKSLAILYGLYADKGSVLPDALAATLGLRWTLL